VDEGVDEVAVRRKELLLERQAMEQSVVRDPAGDFTLNETVLTDRWMAASVEEIAREEIDDRVVRVITVDVAGRRVVQRGVGSSGSIEETRPLENRLLTKQDRPVYTSELNAD